MEAPFIYKLNGILLFYFQEVSHPKGALAQWINLAAQAQLSWQPIILQQNKSENGFYFQIAIKRHSKKYKRLTNVV